MAGRWRLVVEWAGALAEGEIEGCHQEVEGHIWHLQGKARWSQGGWGEDLGPGGGAFLFLISACPVLESLCRWGRLPVRGCSQGLVPREGGHLREVAIGAYEEATIVRLAAVLMEPVEGAPLFPEQPAKGAGGLLLSPRSLAWVRICAGAPKGENEIDGCKKRSGEPQRHHNTDHTFLLIRMNQPSTLADTYWELHAIGRCPMAPPRAKRVLRHLPGTPSPAPRRA